MLQVDTCVGILNHLRKHHSNPTAFSYRSNNEWKHLSTKNFLRDVKYLSLGLRDMGLQRGDKVGILATGSPQWSISNFAIMIAGGVVVPLFSNISDDNFIYEVKQTDIKLLFVGEEEHWSLMQRHASLFNRVITIGEPPADASSSRFAINTFSSLIEKGRLIDDQAPFKYEEMEKEIQPSDLAIIIYTSGSTGTPKGVELTQENIVGFLNNDPYSWDKHTDRYLSVLPLEHVFGYSVNLWMILWGVSIYYSNDYKNLGAICQEVQPTAIVVVPRLLEKIYSKMFDEIQKLKGLKRSLGFFAFKLAQNQNKKILNVILHPILNFLVYSKLRNALGGKLRVVISGGASLDPQLHSFFEQIGIPIYEGWGMTEACPVCASLVDHNKVGNVGVPLKGYEIKTTPEGEILVRGKGVMRGYYKNPEATLKAIDADGWLHTGDRGVLDKEGSLKIFGRMKELYKTSTGEYVAPTPIEQALCRYPLIESALIIAEGRKFSSCLLFPNKEEVKRMQIQQNATTLTEEGFLNGPSVSVEVNKIINQINKHLNHWEQIRAYRFVIHPLSVKDGDLTPSMKIKREAVAKKYGHLIDEMYLSIPAQEKESL